RPGTGPHRPGRTRRHRPAGRTPPRDPRRLPRRRLRQRRSRRPRRRHRRRGPHPPPPAHRGPPDPPAPRPPGPLTAPPTRVDLGVAGVPERSGTPAAPRSAQKERSATAPPPAVTVTLSRTAG